MERNNSRKILRLENGRLRPVEREVVQEFPLTLFVNGHELATLVGSPHQLNFLVAGFFRTHGFVETLDDFLVIGACEESGAAKVQIKKEIPERLSPTLTSGCGTGIAFNLPGNLPRREEGPISPRYPLSAIFGLMKALAQRAENYRAHGGIHSAAVGDGGGLLLYAEDLGRHNTFDRIAGEALFRSIDLRGKLLVTSGRISTEMVGKAARLGIALIASRTSPTDMAVRMSEAAGITLVGYVRGESFEVYTHPERIATAPETEKIPGVTGVILAGGESRRMGSDKSLLPLDGGLFIEHIYQQMASLFDEVILVTNSPSLYQDLPCRNVSDIFKAQCALAGIHSGLYHARLDRTFVVACDMPFLSSGVIRNLCRKAVLGDVVIPESAAGLEPLHALYHRRCLPAMEKALASGQRRIVSFFPDVRIHKVPQEELASLDPEGRSFRNINTPQEYFALRKQEPTASPMSQWPSGIGKGLGGKGGAES